MFSRLPADKLETTLVMSCEFRVSLSCVDMFLALDKDMSGTLCKQELKEYADGTLTDIFIERGKIN